MKRRAIVLAVLGEHMIRYTRDEVLPRLEAELAALPVVADGAPEAGVAEAWGEQALRA